MTSDDIVTQWAPCATCHNPVIHRGDGVYVDAVYGGRYGNEIQVDTDVEHECNPPDESPQARAQSLICRATHNPGVWPYVARCTLPKSDHTEHRDKNDRVWTTEVHPVME